MVKRDCDEEVKIWKSQNRELLNILKRSASKALNFNLVGGKLDNLEKVVIERSTQIITSISDTVFYAPVLNAPVVNILGLLLVLLELNLRRWSLCDCLCHAGNGRTSTGTGLLLPL